MAAILQLRRGVLTDFSDYGTNLSEPYFDTSRDTIHIGTTNGTGSSADWITLVKLSQANSGSTKDEPNTGSLWIVGDITASDNYNVNLGVYDAISNPNGYDPNSGVLPSSIHSTSSMYLNGNLTASHAWFRRDVRIDGHLILGDSDNPSTVDVVNVQADFSGSLIPDNDAYSTQTSTPLLAYHDLGKHTKRWRNLYLGLGANDFISASNADFSGSVKIDGTLETDGQATLASANIEDLTNNRIVIAGINGELEDDEDFTFDGDDFNIGQDNFQVNVSTGNTFTSGTLHTDGQATLASANIEDLTQTRIVIVGTNGELQDSANLTFDDPNFRLIGDYYQSGSGASWQFVGAGGEVTGSWTISELAVDNGIVFTNAEGTLDNSSLFTWDGSVLDITGGISASEDLSVGRQAYIQSALIKDLTEDRITFAGVNGELKDDQYFRYTGNDFIIGSAEHFKVAVSNGNTDISGSVQMYDTLNVDGQSTLASVNIEDLTDNRVVIVGAGGELEDSANLTFNGSLLTVTGDTVITGDLTVQGDTTQLNVSTLNVEDKNILIASGAVNASAADGGGITIDGADATILYSSANDSFQLNKQLQVEGNISGSSFGGTTLLSSSNENFADYSSSVDSRISSNDSDIISLGTTNNTQNTNIGNLQLTGSDHETRINEIETTFSSSVDGRLDLLEAFSTSLDDTFATEAELNSATASLDTQITNVSASFDTTIGALTFDQLADVQDYTASLIPNGYLPVWSSGSQEWRPGRPDFEQGKTRLFVAASRSNTASFYFNSQTRTSDTSASPVDDSAFMLVSSDLDTIKVHLRCSNSVDVTVDIFKNADGVAFSSATSMVTPTTTSLVANTMSTITFGGLTINQFDSIHIKVTPTGGGDFYGIVEII